MKIVSLFRNKVWPLLIFTWWMLSGADGVKAEVNPLSTSLPVQSWMVRLYVQDAQAGYRYILCKGALITSELVLTTGNCLADPFHALTAAGNAKPNLVAKIGSAAELIAVADFRYSPDFHVGLARLISPAQSKPITVSQSTADQLLNRDVYILSDQKSIGIGHDYYNPGQDPHMECTINGSAFITDKASPGRAMCYLLGKSQTSDNVYRTNAKVIDPEASTAPNGALDKLDPFDKTGARLYLDFRASNSYPCNEDLGAPIISDGGDGGPELVGVVAAVGMANGLPICNQALINRFSAIAYYLDYLKQAASESAFAALCPSAPDLHYSYPDDSTAYFYWDAVEGATGYKIHISNDIGYSKIQTTDLGYKTSKELSLAAGIDYTVAVSAYNPNCTSGISKQFTVYQ